MSDGARHNVDYLIIGGGIAGTAAAEVIRDNDERGSIAIVSKEPHELYSRVLLPKYVEGNVSREQVFLRSAENYNARNISLYAGQEVTIVDPAHQEIRTREGKTFFYKQLLIAAGGRVKPWRVQGSNSVLVSRFQTIDDADALREQLASLPAPEVVIVGGGFITLELLNALVPLRLPIRVLMSEKRYWDQFLDETGSAFLEARIEQSGVTISHQEVVTHVTLGKERRFALSTNRRNTHTTDIIAVGIGLDREIELFSGIGIEIDTGIKTDEYMETAVEGIWAAGDIAEVFHPVFGKHMCISNWSNAFLQGRAAGYNMAVRLTQTGASQPYVRIPLYAVDVLGLHIACVGDVFSKEYDGREFIARSQNGQYYEQFIMQGGKLIGAVLMNKFEDQRIIERLISEKRDVTPYLSYFKDEKINLSQALQS
ncbi:MAG: FAD-dependent pyridine nucleotide-disulfide oxidoreductase [Parcubacteria group bacterium Gr01-1014_29]|nr:MAG: FAD-dependent pyridine nucleotide-disulfide oxidoreductase [Parcubacteria group bacterium Gr01-1014_29]